MTEADMCELAAEQIAEEIQKLTCYDEVQAKHYAEGLLDGYMLALPPMTRDGALKHWTKTDSQRLAMEAYQRTCKITDAS